MPSERKQLQGIEGVNRAWLVAPYLDEVTLKQVLRTGARRLAPWRIPPVLREPPPVVARVGSLVDGQRYPD